MSHYDIDLRRKQAADYAKARKAYESAKDILGAATTDLNTKMKARNEIGDNLANCVGKNKPRRVFKIDERTVLIVEYTEKHTNNLITLEICS